MAAYNPCPMEPLETPRLLLRRVELNDAPRIQELFNNFAVLKYMTSAIPWPYPETGAMEYLTSVMPRMEAGQMFLWAIREKSNPDGPMIGQVSLTPESDEDNRGFWLGEHYWGRGYMSEVVLAVTDFAFGPLGMTELVLNNAQPNCGSHRLKEKAGAEIVNIEDRDYIGGRFPGVTWKLTAEAWAKNRQAFLTPDPS